MIRRTRDSSILRISTDLDVSPHPLLPDAWRHGGQFPFIPAPRLEFITDIGLGLANNDPVGAFTGQSIYCESASQATGTSKPTFKSAGGSGSRTCIDFDGGDFLTLDRSIPGQKLTIEAVFKYSDTNPRTIIGGSGSSLQFRTFSNKLEVNKAAVASLGTNTTTLSAGTWYHAAITWNSLFVAFYLNGVADGVGSTGTTLGSNILDIGQANAGERFLGSIMLVRLWQCVLTPQQLGWSYARNFARCLA